MEHRLYVDGRWREAAHGATLALTSPATEHDFAMATTCRSVQPWGWYGGPRS